MTGLITFTAAFIVSYFGVALFLRWSRRRGVFDIPNERSLHTTPIPRGGGIVIVVVCLLSYLVISLAGLASFSWGYVLGAASIAAISWIDDLRSVSFIWRFLVHSLAAVVLIFDAGYFREVYIPVLSTNVDLGLFGAVITFFWIVWIVNAFNFMDGIDGIAGVQTVAASLGWLFIGYYFGNTAIFYFSGVLLFSSLGFLFYNWHPARIFLGDVGSAFLGFTFAGLPLLARGDSDVTDGLFALAALCFLWFFLFDTVITFARRSVKGRKVWQPHREHLYQRLVISGLPHQSVSLLYGVFASLVVLLFTVNMILRGIFDLLLVLSLLSLAASLVVLTFVRKSLT